MPHALEREDAEHVARVEAHVGTVLPRSSGRDPEHPEEPHHVIDAQRAGVLERTLQQHLPDEMMGREFLARYGDVDDSVTSVQPDRQYRVCAPTAHPIYERQRAEEFRMLLTRSPDEPACVRLGELMYASHASYGHCGLGSPGTDRLVDIVRREGTASGLYGARITGGGSGGSVTSNI